MKTLFFLFLISPFQLWAQSDTLKPIGSDVTTGYGRYGNGVRIRYMYDGIDVRSPKDLGHYILASGDVNAIQEFQSYQRSRQTGTLFVVLGTAAAVGGMIGLINARSAPDSQNPFQGPARFTTGPTGGGAFLVGLTGTALIGLGWGMRLPGPHLRRAVQYYNRSLKRRGISWKMSPYSSFTNTGLGLIGRF